MLDELKKSLQVLKEVNQSKINDYNFQLNRLEEVERDLEKFKEEYNWNEFLIRTLSDYYKMARSSNLKDLGVNIGRAMTYILNKPYQVKLDIKKRGVHDYLEILVNNTPAVNLSGGEKQVLSVLLVVECVTNPVVILDETINSLDPITRETVVEYLQQVSSSHQIFLIELADDLDIDYSYIVEEGGVIKCQ